MRHEPVPHEELDAAIERVRYMPRVVRMLAVRAEMAEQEKEHRDIPQATIAMIVGVDPRTLRTWTDRFRAEGVEGLRARGGQGRKPKLSDEDMAKAIKKAQEGGGFQSSPEAEADKCGACRAEAEDTRAAEAGEKKRPSRRPPAKPVACKCDRDGRECDKPGKCTCRPGRACKCQCCRDPRLPRRGPRHASGCPRARVWPVGAVTAAILCAVVFDMFGVAYSISHMYAIMPQHGLVSKKLSFVHVNHASGAAVRAWQRRLRVRLKKLRKAGYVIASFDECFMVRDKAAGRVWVEMGMKAMQVYAGSRERIALFGYYFEGGTHRFQEYKFADSYALINSLERIANEFGKVAIIMDRASPHNSDKTRKLIRKYRREHPGHDIQLIFLPRGSPYLNVVEECWALLKANVARFYFYPRFDDFRWAVTDHLRTTQYRLEMDDYLYCDPGPHLPAGAKKKKK